MRIFYASDTTPNAAFQSNLWRNNLYQPLVDLGHDVVEFQYNLRKTFQNLNPQDPRQKAFIHKNRSRVTKELLRQIRVAHSERLIDLFFSYFYDACVLPEAIDEIRSMGIKTVNWYCNGSYQLHLVSEISPHYDWCLVPERFRLDDYKAMGANPIYCQEAANPNICKPYDLPVEFDVTFVGQAYGDRPAYIKYLLDQGIDVRVWGWGWQDFSPDRMSVRRFQFLDRPIRIAKALLTPAGWRAVGRRLINLAAASSEKTAKGCPEQVRLPASVLGGILSDEEMIRMYSRSKINIGFSTCGNTHETERRILQVRLRDFEVPMSGGFYMVEYMEELKEFFEVGKEMICYYDKADLVHKIKYYLSHDSEREEIRQAGYLRAKNDHSWQKRFTDVFNQAGLV